MANKNTNGYDDEEMTVELELDDGEKVTCAIITILTVEKKDYIVLLPLDEEGNNDDGEVWFYRYFEDESDPNAEPQLEYIDDDDEYENVADAFDEYLDNVEFDEVVKEEDDGFELEEYAEAYPYEGGPVAGVVMAEEVNPSFLRHEPHVQTAGYDFYNSKSFDPFIATLNEDERNQFTEIFILRYHGMMPDIPDYQVGGDNAEFFRRIFIYLGQYRDRIPDALLAKIYQFAIKLQ